jgi:hypothetical protein
MPATTLLLVFADLAPSVSRLDIGDPFKSTGPVENKRHTKARQPITSYSAIGATIPPSPPDL